MLIDAFVQDDIYYCISEIFVQLQLLFKLNRPFEVASRGFSFIISFSKALAMHEVLVLLFYKFPLPWKKNVS